MADTFDKIVQVSVPLGADFNLNTETGSLDPECPSIADFEEFLIRKIKFPGGFDIDPITDFTDKHFTKCTYVIDLTKQIQPILVALQPIFKIMECIVKVLDCIKAIKKAVKPPNPRKITSALKNLAECISVLEIFFPLLSVPPMLLSLIDTFILVMQCLQEYITNTLTFHVDFSKMAQDAHKCSNVSTEENPVLQALLCSWNEIVHGFNNQMLSMQMLNTLVVLLNTMIDVISQMVDKEPKAHFPSFDAFGNIGSGDILDLIDSDKVKAFQDKLVDIVREIDKIIVVLSTLKDFILTFSVVKEES